MAILNGHEVVFVKPVDSSFDFEDTISDKWDSIILNANAGTVSGYSVGDTKTLEFVYNGIPVALRCRIADKNHFTISGTQNKAPLLFVFEDLIFTNAMNGTATNTGGYKNSALRTFISGMFQYFPTNLKNAIKTVDIICDTDESGLETITDKLFVPSVEETGLTTGNIVTGQGTAFAYFDSASKRIKTNIKGTKLNWWTRSRNTQGVNFYAISTIGLSAANTATSSSVGVVIAFCI